MGPGGWASDSDSELRQHQYTSAAAEGCLNFEAVRNVKIQIHGEVQKQKGTTVGDGASPNIETPAGTVQYTSAATEGCLKF